VWRKPKEWKSKTQKKSLGKSRNQDREVESNHFSQKPFSLICPNPRKTPNRLFNLKPKKLFLITVKTLESQEKFAQKFLKKTGH